jgi:hypothetical protein
MAAQAEANPAILGVLVLAIEALNSKMVPFGPGLDHIPRSNPRGKELRPANSLQRVKELLEGGYSGTGRAAACIFVITPDAIEYHIQFSVVSDDLL